MVNEEFARLYLPTSPLGERFPWRRRKRRWSLKSSASWGMSSRMDNPSTAPRDLYGLAGLGTDSTTTRWSCGPRGQQRRWGAPVRDMVKHQSSAAAVDVALLAERVANAHAYSRFSIVVFTLIAGLSLVVTAAGLYGALSYAVALRRREFGIRVAVGATRTDLVRLVLRRGMTPALIGLTAGVAVAPVATQARCAAD